jgi:hypothetical protein
MFLLLFLLHLLFLLLPLEHRASVKHFPSLQFLNLRRVGRSPWTEDQPVARPIPNTYTEQTQTGIHALVGIRNQGLRIPADEGILANIYSVYFPLSSASTF